MKSALIAAICTLTLGISGVCALRAQELDPADLLKPAGDSWTNYHGDYTGKRHSSLTQITPRNVDDLGLAWAFQNRSAGTDQVIPSHGRRSSLLHRP